MRVLFVTIATGGAASALYNLVLGMRGQHEIAVVVPGESAFADSLEAIGIKVYKSETYRLSVWPQAINPVKYYSQLRQVRRNKSVVRDYIGRVIDDFQPDIVHTNVGPLDIALEPCRKRGIPHVWHQREYQAGMTFYPSRKSFLKMIHLKGNWNIAISEGISRFWHFSDRDRVVFDGVFSKVINNVDNFNIVDNSGNSDCKSCGKRPYFLYAGRIEKNKGLLDVLKAFRIFCRNDRSYVLKVAGVPSKYYALRCRRYIARHKLGGRVEFLGQADNVRGLMAGAGAFIMSSYCEGFGLTTVEAMLERCIVIGRDDFGTREQFDRGLGLMGREIALRFDDVAGLAGRMAEVAGGTEDLEDMREAAYRTVIDSYSIEQSAASVTSFYEDILNLHTKRYGE